MTKKGEGNEAMLANDMHQSVTDMTKGMSMMFYASWYNDQVSPHLTKEQKEKLIKKLFDLSAEYPIQEAGIEFPVDDFPELKPFANTSKLTGLQLYAVYTELFHELYPEQAAHIKRPYPTLPSKRLRA